MTPADRPFVVSSWFESFRKGGCAPEVPFPLYKEGQGQLIDRLLDTTRTLVAAASAVPDEICGWVCFAGPQIIHYVYVKQAYRRLGIAGELVALYGGALKHTHETKTGRKFFAKAGSTFNPYILTL